MTIKSIYKYLGPEVIDKIQQYYIQNAPCQRTSMTLMSCFLLLISTRSPTF